jgi:hypothetical protein
MSVSGTFDDSNPNWSEYDGQNVMFLAACQQHARDILFAKGFITLNEVYNMLGLEQTEEGALSGWVGDAYLDFGVSGEIGGESPIELTFNINSTNVFRDK